MKHADQDKARRARRDSALTRPELRYASDGFKRAAPTSPHAAPIKTVDASTRAMIDAALKGRAH